MERPYIICHMLASIDGKSTGGWLYDKHLEQAVGDYFFMHSELKCDATAIGKNTLNEMVVDKNFKLDLSKYQGENLKIEDYVVCTNCQKGYCLAFDKKGTIPWQKNEIEIKDYTSYNEWNAHNRNCN